MGGRGAYWDKIGKDAKKHSKKYSKNNQKPKESDSISFEDKQIGKKAGKHCEDFGLDAKKPEDRGKFFDITKDIIDNADVKKTGTWRGQTGTVTFYAKGTDVVVVDQNNNYITTLKDGVNNQRYKEAKG